MQVDKKQVEVLLINYFRECYVDFPKGKMIATESPDFVVKMKNAHLLGIELTRLNPANASPASEVAKQKTDFRERLILNIKQNFERNCKLNLFVKFLFSENIEIKPERELAIAVKMALLIKEKVKHKNAQSFFSESINNSELPEGFDEVVILCHPGLKTPVWERSNNLGISNDVVDDIRKSIDKKNEKLKLYQKQHLNYYWLLITTDHLRGIRNYNLANHISNQVFHSRFQHVFLFDLVKGKVFELV